MARVNSIFILHKQSSLSGVFPTDGFLFQKCPVLFTIGFYLYYLPLEQSAWAKAVRESNENNWL
jgi:hypothetical protein